MSDLSKHFVATCRNGRKNYSCTECAGRIPAGERHLQLQRRDRGVWLSYRICEDCIFLREKIDAAILRRDPNEGGLYAGELVTAVMDWPDPEFRGRILSEFMGIREKRSSPATRDGRLERLWESWKEQGKP